jgi:hypothetical protein
MIRKCFTRKLDGNWSWTFYLWLGTGIFADCKVDMCRGIGFPDQEQASLDMERVIKMMKIKADRIND